MTINQLEQCSAADITVIPRKELVDIRSVHLNEICPIEKRMRSYLEQIKNPYCFLCDNIPVKISFSDEEHTLQERLTRYFVFRKRT